MKRERDHHVEDLSGRIKSLDMFTGSLVGRSQPEPAAEAIPVHEPAPLRAPLPRRSRVFLRHGSGVFADLTLTAPRPRTAVD
ncbi:hypothetical protein GCM10009641_37920 [Mycobacterium cookii]|uniref:Uncharacterized protein n=1 Tax=Nocardioides furvisabuli TaxID=375542 RepID=A0ABN2X3A0_9ACTN|nr:hypothetical protein [Nocardioides furvisabuli]